MTHRLILTHTPWWLASCSCGEWTGVSRRHANSAAKQHRQHVRVVHATSSGTWRSPTPVCDLPDELRVGV